MKKSYIYYNQIDKEPGINQQQNFDLRKKKIVDINKLLNRVKIDQKNETKQKIIFYSFTTLGLSLLGTLIALLK